MPTGDRDGGARKVHSRYSFQNRGESEETRGSGSPALIEVGQGRGLP